MTQSGPANIGALLNHAQQMEGTYWRIGPGRPEALPYLDQSIAAVAEAHGYLQAADAMRGLVGAKLGIQLAARHIGYGGGASDRDKGISALAEALTFSNLPPVLHVMANLSLGQLYMSRMMGNFSTIAMGMPLIAGDEPSLSLPDADLAIACFRAVLDAEPLNQELTTVAETLLELTVTLKDTVKSARAGRASFDFRPMIDMLGRVQELRDRLKRSSVLDLNLATLAALDPLDRPVAVVHGRAASATPDRPDHVQAPMAQLDRAQLRESLHAKLRAAAGTAPPKISDLAAALMLPAAPALTNQVADEIVALASMLVDDTGSAVTDDPVTAGIDWFLMAAALRIRDRADNATDGADRIDGLDCLLKAARTIPTDHPAVITVLRCLGAFLDRRLSHGGLPELVSQGFADRVDSVLASRRVAEPADRATLYALRCLCRADDAAACERAVAATPRDYPWLDQLKAVQHVTFGAG